MSWMKYLQPIISNLPDVAAPTQKKLGFKEKLKWTLIILVIFYILGKVPLFGLGQNQLTQFEILSIILGAQFGSIVSLGIGPLVTASIVLQLLNGSGILKFDLTTQDGKKQFQGLQKLLSIFFIIFEACIYVFMGGLAPREELIGTFLYFQLELLIVFQLVLGGLLIMFMDGVCSKWGFGSGISLFIAAGVSQSLFIRAFSTWPSPGGEIASGAIPAFFQTLANGDPKGALLQVTAVLSTVLVFAIAVFFQAMKVEIPLSFGRIRGHGIRWPLSFMYTSNIPVILVSAMFANIQLWAHLLQNYGYPLLGRFVGNSPVSGLVFWTSPPQLVEKMVTGSFTFFDLFHAFGFIALMIIGCIIFGYFWVQTAGMDSASQAKQILSSGLQIPGFRKDQRVLERLLDRYINPLTIMGAIAVGLLAGIADISGALTNGTGLLLAVMIVYRLYEDIAKQHMMDMNPMLRKFMGG